MAVNAIAPGGTKTDMYIEAVRKYILGEASMTDKEIDGVSYNLRCGQQYVC